MKQMISSGHYQIPSGHYQVPPASFFEPAFDHLEIHPKNIQICTKLGEGQFGTVHIAKVKIDATIKIKRRTETVYQRDWVILMKFGQSDGLTRKT